MKSSAAVTAIMKSSAAVTQSRGFVTGSASMSRRGRGQSTPRPAAQSAVVVELARAIAAVTQVVAMPGLPDAAHQTLDSFLSETSDLHKGVPVSAAAQELGLTAPTIRAWVDRGILELVPDVSPKQVSVRSLGLALAAVETIRAVGSNQRLLTRIIEVMDDLRVRRELAASVAEFAEREEFDPFDVESIFA